MYGPLRFLISNLIPGASSITMSNMSPGVVTGAKKIGTGSALLTVSGLYTGISNKLFLWQIHDVSAGNEVGQALARWRTNETASGTWEDEDITTSTLEILLEEGVYVASTAGPGNDFENLDYWEFRALALWGPGRMLDLRRNTFGQSNASTTLNCVIDLGSAKNITAAALYDHNLTSSATLALEGNATDAWGAPTYTNSITVVSGTPVVEYINETFRYWRWVISDVTNPDGYISIGGMYIGTYTELANKVNGEWGSSEEYIDNMIEQRNPAGVIEGSTYSSQRNFILYFGRTLNNTDYETLKGVFQVVRIPSTRQSLPLYVHVFSDVDSYFMLANLQGSLPRTYSSYLWNQSSINFLEVANTAF